MLRNQKGFSILEVMIGTAVFTIGMLGVAALLTSSLRGGAFSGNLTEANELAAGKIEELMMAPYDPALDVPKARLADDHGGHGAAGLSDATAATADGVEAGVGRNGIYTIFWNVAEDTPLPDVKTITVIVQWRIKDVVQQISFTTYRASVL